MKKLITILLSLNFLISSTIASADTASDFAGAVLITFGAAKGLSYLNATALEEMQLEEWKDQNAQITAELGDQCGLYYEAHLVGDISVNYLWLSLKNSNTEQVLFNPIDVDFRFSNGVIRKADLYRFNEVFFESQRLYNLLLPFPAKEDFKNEKFIEITLPVKTATKSCEIKIKMLRNANVEDTLRSTVSMDRIDLELGFGSANYSGNFKKLFAESRGTITAFETDIYGAHGGGLNIGFRLSSELLSDSTIANQAASAESEARLNESHIGYVHRYFINKNEQLHWRLGLSGLSLAIWNDVEKTEEYSTSGVDTQIYYQRYFNRVKSGVWRGNYYWGLNLSNSHYSYKKEMQGQDILNGNITSIMIVLGLGN